mmetsp:Transcript_4336/g.10151  ORF Transcript_4336/g.10151 Transcript_4336/m.10151 type:complete len:368 (+) Transcript_4336:109-1212(+)
MIRKLSSFNLIFAAVVITSIGVAAGFVAPTTNSQQFIAGSQSKATFTPSYRLEYGRSCRYFRGTRLYNKWLDFLSPEQSKIPEELRDEIYQAEANTAAARDRGTRVAVYASLAIFGVALASLNGFLTDLRDKETAIALANAASSIPDTGNNLYILEQNGFGWVLSNPVFKFLFTNKIGGILTLLFGGGSGLMAEAEFDTKRLNAEKIYEELERRREQKLKKPTSSGGVRRKNKKKRRSGKEKKRLAAISEVVMDDVADKTELAAIENGASSGTPVVPPSEISSEDSSTKDNAGTNEGESETKGVFGKMKNLYEKADSMAASQALIMNKNLEEAGVVEKITDETGLKVIGRDEAKKLEENSTTDEKKQ